MTTKRANWLRVGLVIGVGALLLAACTVPRHGECSGAVCVEWNQQPQQDIAFLNRVIEHGRQEIGYRLHGQAQVIFVEPNGLIASTPGARSRYEPDEDVIYLVYESDLRWTHIAHELLHRDIYLSTGDADGKHRDPRWSRFRCGSGNVPCGVQNLR